MSVTPCNSVTIIPGRRPHRAATLRGWTSATTTYSPLVASRIPLSNRPKAIVARPATSATTAMAMATRSMVRWSIAEP